MGEILLSKGEVFMYTLFIDTHYISLHLALFKDGQVVDEVLKDEAKHSTYFIPLLKELLEKNHVPFEKLSGIIVVNGPGSFTGVRIGVVVAKMMGYCKNIPLKAISYLQALSLKYDEDVIIGIKDRNGAFVGSFNKDHDLRDDYFYLSNQELDDYPEKIIIDDSINLDMVYKYLKNKEEIHPHLLKPIYVKKIEVGK